MAALVFAITLVFPGNILQAQELSGKGEPPAGAAESGESEALANSDDDAEFEELDLSPEFRNAIEDLPADQRKAVKKLVTLLMKNVFLLFVWFGAMFLALIVPFRWIYLAFKNQKGWGITLLLLYLFTCITPLFVAAMLIYAIKNRDESKKYFVFTLLVYLTFYGVSGYIAQSAKGLAGDLGAIEAAAPEAEGAPENAPPDSAKSGVKKADPKSRLGKIMAAAEENIAKAEERSAEGSNMVEKASQTGTVKPKAPAPEKAAAPKTAPPTVKKTDDAPASEMADDTPTAPTETEGPARSGYAKAPANLRVVSILDGAARKTAMINDGVRNQMVVEGGNITVAIGGGTKRAEVVEILADAVIIRLDGRAAPMAINAPKQ